MPLHHKTNNLHMQISCAVTAQHLCFHYTDSTPALLHKSSVTVQVGLCLTMSKSQIVGFLIRRLKSFPHIPMLFYRLDGVLSTVKALLQVILTSSDSSDVMTVAYQLFVEIPTQVPSQVGHTSILKITSVRQKFCCTGQEVL